MSALSALVAAGATASEKWRTGGITTLIGMGMTFVMLALLILAMLLLRHLLRGLDKAAPEFRARLRKNANKRETPDETAETASIEPAGAKIDEQMRRAIAEAAKEYVKSTSRDGKAHDDIRILKISEADE